MRKSLWDMLGSYCIAIETGLNQELGEIDGESSAFSVERSVPEKWRERSISREMQMMGEELATLQQLSMLERMGINVKPNVTKREASRLIDGMLDMRGKW